MINEVIKNEGIYAFYKGITANLVMTVNPVLNFTFYELMKKSLLNNDKDDYLSSIYVIAISFFAKLFTTFLTYPILTIKTLFQANENKTDDEIFSIIKNIFRSQGFLGLYKGMMKYYKFLSGIFSKLVQTLVNSIILMLTHERILRFFNETL